MARSYKRKRADPPPDSEVLRCAVTEVIEKRMSLRVAASYFGLKKSTIQDYVKKFKHSDVIPDNVKHEQHWRQVFSVAMETELRDYLTTCCRMSHGLSTNQLRELAYQFAVSNNLNNVPKSWIEKKRASEDWVTAFLKRNPALSIRRPEPTSQARASGFNRVVVNAFFDLLVAVMAKYNFPPSRIWNTDETGIPTVLAPPKVVAVRGLKQVQQTVSHERGVNTTMIAFVSAGGTQIPPVYIFPRVKFVKRMTDRGPPGCLGLAHPSGWVNKDTFLRSLQHFVEFTMCSTTNPHLLLLDNHSSHLDPAVVKYAKENGIVMLTFPPHCSHKLQPLDVSVFSSFKGALQTTFDDWLTSHSGSRISFTKLQS